MTLRCWTAVVEGALLSWLQERTLPREALDTWLVDQLTAMLGATAAHEEPALSVKHVEGTLRHTFP